MRRSSWGQMVTSCSSWLGTFHSSRKMYVVVASHLLVPFTRRPDLSHFQPDEPTLSLPSRIYTGGLEIAKVRTSTFLCVFISLNTISAVRRMVSRNAHALALGRRLRQGSIGTRRWNAALPRVRPGKYFLFPSLSPSFSHSLTSTAGVTIFPLLLHRDTLWRLSRYLRGSQHHTRAHRGSSKMLNLTLRTRDFEESEDTSLEYVRRYARLEGRHAVPSRR